MLKISNNPDFDFQINNLVKYQNHKDIKNIENSFSKIIDNEILVKNFEITDNDESDQIGLTSFYSAPYPSVYPSNDEVMWSQLTPGIFQVPEQNVDQTFLYGSGYISLQPGEKKKFSRPPLPRRGPLPQGRRPQKF